MHFKGRLAIIRLAESDNMIFAEITVDFPKLVRARDNTEIELENIELHSETKRLLLSILNGNTRIKLKPHDIVELTIDKLVISKTVYQDNEFSTNDIYSMKSSLTLTDVMGIQHVGMIGIQEFVMKYARDVKPPNAKDPDITFYRFPINVRYSSIFIQAIDE